MADKSVMIQEPVLRDVHFSIGTDAGGFFATVACPQEGGIANGKRITGADLTAVQRAAGQTFLSALLAAAKAQWGGY